MPKMLAQLNDGSVVFKSGGKVTDDRSRSGRQAMAATTDTKDKLMYFFGIILWEMCESQFRAVCTDIKQFKTTNSMGSAEEEDE